MVELYNGQPMNEVINNDLTVVQYFATWCNPCKMLSPIVDAVSEDLKDDAKFIKVDIDQFRDLAVEAGIRGVPTLIVYKNGKEVSRQSGYQQKQAILNWISSYK